MRLRNLSRSHVIITAILILTALTMTTMLTNGSISKALASERADPDDALVTALDGVLAGSALAGSTTSMQVLEEATGDVVYSKAADQRVVPASTAKLMTSAAALEYLGADFRFHTTVSHSGSQNGATVDGNLIIKGTGDPTLTQARFDEMAEKVAAQGITSFTGDLIADASAFDRTPLGPDWTWDDESASYAAPISALTAAANSVFDTGSVAITARPGKAAGEAGVLSLTPSNSYVKIENNTVTGAADSSDTVTAVRNHATNTIVVSGSIPLSGKASTDLVAVQDATLLAASAFRAALSRHNVEVTGKTVVKATSGTVQQIVDLSSSPLSELLPPFLKLSNNGHAELLVKAMGRKATGKAGSWSNGLAQARTTLTALGVSVSTVMLRDGSGLSRRDLLTTREIAELLENVKTEPWFKAWYDALPIAGADGQLVGGTLTNRFRGTLAANNLHAKTGTLTGVNALSGYVTDTTGRRLVFSIVSNNATANVSSVLDQAAEKLAAAGSSAKLSARRVTPAVPRTLSTDGQDVECSWVQAC
jgi:serine-type D-Ala-D-Ala carboxypeptidase/endopeptidase (penicillin-binding protein 4)